MVQFLDDDIGYLDWIARNPPGWIVKSNCNPNPELHRSAPGFVRIYVWRINPGMRWTKDYCKRCGTPAELHQWAQQPLGREPTVCSHCG
jgi:hypothetical protein